MPDIKIYKILYICNIYLYTMYYISYIINIEYKYLIFHYL